MDETQIHEFASQLLRAHGDGAEVEAARRARESDDKGDTREAGNWRRVRAAIAAMRGPHVS